VAVYADNVYVQPDDDRAILHKGTDEWWPSAFRDIDMERLEVFSLVNQEKEAVATVDLKTGLFTVNDLEFSMHGQDQMLKDFKLIYFREMRRDNVGGEWQNAQVMKYYFGYEATDQDGKKVKLIMGLEP